MFEFMDFDPIKFAKNTNSVWSKKLKLHQKIVYWVLERIVLIIASITMSFALILSSLWPFGNGTKRLMTLVNTLSTMWLAIKGFK